MILRWMIVAIMFVAVAASAWAHDAWDDEEYMDPPAQFQPNILPDGSILLPPAVQVPLMRARPVAPPVMRIRRMRGGGYYAEPDPNFRTFWVPQSRRFRAGEGPVVYQMPEEYLFYYRQLPPYPYAYPPFRHERR